MDDIILQKIVLSALLHDIGKVYQRTGQQLPEEYIRGNRDIYQRFINGHYTHKHVLYTAKFIEDFKDYIPSLFLQEEKAEYSLINLSAKHHKPETPWEWIIHEADRLSSGFERRNLDEEIKFEKGETSANIPLLTIFEDLSLSDTWKKDKLENYRFAYKLDVLSPESIFPVERTNGLATQEKYEKIWLSFIESFKEISILKERPDIWLEALNTLMLKYFLFIPSATVGAGTTYSFVKILSDISLYDHSYFTASLASTLYLYHKNTDSLTEQSIKKRDESKFLFIEGNFYGIQKFIFASGGETRKWAAKILRGRSFMVSMYSELVADYIMRQLGLPFVNLLYSAAGKFLIIAPNLTKVKEKLRDIENELNEWLYQYYYGETSIGLTYIEAKPEAFLNEDGYSQLLKRLGKKSEEKKYKKFDIFKFGGVIEDYLSKFSKLGVCKLCGKRPAEINEIFERENEKEEIPVCSICRDQKRIGEALVKNKFILIYGIENREINTGFVNTVPILNKYYAKFEDKSSLCKRELANKNLISIWDIALPASSDEERKVLFARKFINAYVPLVVDNESKIPLSFEELANLSLKKKNETTTGIEALGVIKADVDNLGSIFLKGLPPSKRTFTRYLALSRMLNLFFAFYLPYLCQTKFKNIYNVFCGGDDLFVVGPWEESYNFILKVREEFKKYVCCNKDVTLSAGYLLTKPNIPVIELAERTEFLLSQAKKAGRNRLFIFKTDIVWDNIPTLEQWKIKLISLCDEDTEILTKSFLYKLNDIIEMVAKEKELISTANSRSIRGIPLNNLKNELKCLLWRSLLYYFTVRNFDKKRRLDEEIRQKELEEFLKEIKDALENYGEAFRLPLWQILYSTRRAKDDTRAD
jgi:CRISPR-associated protein Csm1